MRLDARDTTMHLEPVHAHRALPVRIRSGHGAHQQVCIGVMDGCIFGQGWLGRSDRLMEYMHISMFICVAE